MNQFGTITMENKNDQDREGVIRFGAESILTNTEHDKEIRYSSMNFKYTSQAFTSNKFNFPSKIVSLEFTPDPRKMAVCPF